MGYDRGDSFPFDFEPNEIQFSSKSKRKLSPRLYPIQCERKWKHSFLSGDHQIDEDDVSTKVLVMRKKMQVLLLMLSNISYVIKVAIININAKNM